jgi:RNA polymerase subunit RPABC4/transcription elongation factor Spt4
VSKEDAFRFRQRASDCRRISDQAKSPEWRDSLVVLAAELEAEADKIEGEEED